MMQLNKKLEAIRQELLERKRILDEKLLKQVEILIIEYHYYYYYY